jgi:O-antigen/teichoic acid export membrane protein
MLRNVGSTWVVVLATIAATYVLTPFVIESLGREGYGIWTLITALTGYLSLCALGVPMASLRYLAQHVAERDTARLNQTIGSCAGLYLMMGGAALVLGGVLTYFFLSIIDVPPGFRAEAPLALALMAVTVSAGFIGLLPEGILFAHHDFVARNLVRLAGVLVRLGLTVSVLAWQSSLVALAAVQIACFCFDFGVSWLIVRRRYPGVRISLAGFNWAALRRVLSFSVYVLLLTAGTRLIFETNALVIGAFWSVGDIAYYVVANSLIVYEMDFVLAIAGVVLPMATRLQTEGRLADLREVFLKWSKVAFSLALAIGAFLFVLGPRFIGWWIEPSFEAPSGTVLQILVVSSLAFLPVRGVALPTLMGLGKPRIPTIAFLITGLANLALSIALVGPLGLAGVALGTAIPNVGFAIVMIAVACRELDIAPLEYVRYVVPKVVLGVVPVLAFLAWCRFVLDVASFTGLVAAGSAMLLLFGVMSILVIYRHDPYVDLRAQLGRARIWRERQSEAS